LFVVVCYIIIYKVKYRLTRKTTHCFLLVGTFLRQPQIVKPFDNFHLQMIRHSPHPHVCLHAIQLRCNQQAIVFVTICDLEWQLGRKHIHVIFHSFCSTRLYFLIKCVIAQHLSTVRATPNETLILDELIAHIWYTPFSISTNYH